MRGRLGLRGYWSHMPCCGFILLMRKSWAVTLSSALYADELPAGDELGAVFQFRRFLLNPLPGSLYV